MAPKRTSSPAPPQDTASRSTKRRKQREPVIQYTRSAHPSDTQESKKVRTWIVESNQGSSSTHRYGATRKTAALKGPDLPVEATVVGDGQPVDPDDHSWEEERAAPEAGEKEIQVEAPKKNPRNDSTKMRTWLEDYRQTFIEELVRRDGTGAEDAACSNCHNETKKGTVRCLDCTYDTLTCQDCAVKLHQRTPLHRVEVWKDGHFQRTSLTALGLVVQLNHGTTRCSVPLRIHDPFVVIDMNGSHHLELQYCGCSKGSGIEKYQQLLRSAWYPASLDRPRTAFTFDLLDTYHKLTLQGKLNLYDFYRGILQKTDNCGRKKKLYRYHELSRCVRQWRHLKMLKRGGSAHLPGGVISTAEGGLAVECPACPHPGRNSPVNLDDIPAEKRWLHAVFLAIDANFRLKLKARGVNDPELGSGWAYFVGQTEYAQHLNTYEDEKNIKACGSTFNTISEAGSKFSKGYDVTGVGAAVCARHNFIQKNGVGDLQKGERQCNIDYIVLSALKHERPKDIKLSYDIACSWSKHVHERIETHYPVQMQLADGAVVVFLIPKFHLPSHGRSCQTTYSFNFVRFVGRTHGETVEQEWSHINGAVLMTREMGPGARHAALDDHWGGWNWMKLINLGDYLATSFNKAAIMKGKHRALVDRYSETASREDIKAWTDMMEAWHLDHRKPNPFAEIEEAVSQAQIRATLADEESKEVKRGNHFPHQVTAAVFVRLGLELEEQQRMLKNYIELKSQSTGTSKALLQEKRNSLNRQIAKWREIQRIYMPGVAALQGSGVSEDVEPQDLPLDDRPESTELWLPSAVDKSDRAGACIRGVVQLEQRMRLAQVQDALIELRRARRLRRGLLNHFRIRIAGTGQRAITRSQTIMLNNSNRITRAVDRYNSCRLCLYKLDPDGDWTKELRELLPGDNAGPGRDPDDEPTGQGNHVTSWIWIPGSTLSSDANSEKKENEEFKASMRVEWARSVARAERWEEEFELLAMEMWRTLVFLEWKAHDWENRAKQRPGVSVDLQRGLDAYASKQARIFRDLGKTFRDQWMALMTSLKLTFPLPDFTPDVIESPTPADPQVSPPTTLITGEHADTQRSAITASFTPLGDADLDNDDDAVGEVPEELRDHDDELLDLDFV